MKVRKLTFLGLLVFSFQGILAQTDSITSITFSYDDSGNRESREIVYYQGGLKSARFVQEKEEVPEFEKELRVYPNPASQSLYVVLNEEAIEASRRIIYLYDNTGKQIKQLDAHGDVNRIDVSDLPVGTYILKLIYGSKHKEWIILKN